MLTEPRAPKALLIYPPCFTNIFLCINVLCLQPVVEFWDCFMTIMFNNIAERFTWKFSYYLFIYTTRQLHAIIFFPCLTLDMQSFSACEFIGGRKIISLFIAQIWSRCFSRVVYTRYLSFIGVKNIFFIWQIVVYILWLNFVCEQANHLIRWFQ